MTPERTMKDQNERKIIKGWVKSLESTLEPAGQITGLKHDGNNLIISYLKDIPNDFSLRSGNPYLVIADLLKKQAELSYQEGIDDAVEVVTNHIMDAEGWIPFEKLDVLRQELESLKKQS